MSTNKIAIAIDGPAAAGKSTVAKMVANKLSYVYIDTGAMYRALTYKAVKQGIPLDDEEKLSSLLINTIILLEQSNQGQRVILDEKDITEEIRSHEVTNHVSYVAEHPLVRKEMVLRQKELASKRGVVMDGRDIGTHVIPNAEVKVFLIATVEERARRRHEENLSKGLTSDLQLLMNEIKHRDSIDSKRATAPLLKAEDAIEIDTTSLSIEEVAQEILQLAYKILGQ